MKRLGFISTTVLSLFLGMTASVFAQQDDRDKPAAEPAAREGQAAPQDEKREPEARPAQENEKRTQQDDRQVQEQNNSNRDAKDQEKREPKDENQAQDQDKQQQKNLKNAQQNDKNNPQARPGQDAQRAGGNSGGRIPDDKFRAHFGQQHHFRISRPTVVSGQPRFQYGGYWFVIADPWPVGWDYADDCYIDYVNGEYLLFDLAHPGVSIVVSVVL